MFYSIALIAYIIDNIFGEFEKLKFKTPLKHPIIYMGDYISWFQKKYYKDSILRGAILTATLIFIVYIITSWLATFDNILFQGFLASFTL